MRGPKIFQLLLDAGDGLGGGPGAGVLDFVNQFLVLNVGDLLGDELVGLEQEQGFFMEIDVRL